MNKNSPANAGDTGLIPGPGTLHMLWNIQACVPQLLSAHAAGMLLGQGGVEGHVCLICPYLSINPAHSKCLIHVWKGKKEDEKFPD